MAECENIGIQRHKPGSFFVADTGSLLKRGSSIQPFGFAREYHSYEGFCGKRFCYRSYLYEAGRENAGYFCTSYFSGLGSRRFSHFPGEDRSAARSRPGIQILQIFLQIYTPRVVVSFTSVIPDPNFLAISLHPSISKILRHRAILLFTQKSEFLAFVEEALARKIS